MLAHTRFNLTEWAAVIDNQNDYADDALMENGNMKSGRRLSV